MAYTPTQWKDGDVISADRLNKLEQGVANEQAGPNGTTFTPAVSEEGVISWTNDGGLPNPEPVDIKGAPGGKGDPGSKGDPGEDGEDGFSPTVAVTDISGGHRVTITDAEGPHSFDVMDGQDSTGGGGTAGVTSFNGRDGAVTPQEGDYTAAMVGARADTWTPTAAEISVAPPDGMTATDVQGAVSELFQSVSEGKALIASAVTDKGIPTAADATFQTMHDNILDIESGGLPDNVRTITVTADPPEGGTVSGGGVASDGMTVTVKAEVAEGYRFDEWKENGQSVSESTEYTFTANEDRTLVAAFTASRLPKGYTELQYINWVGANNTFVTLDPIHGTMDRIVLKFYPTSYQTGSYSANFLYFYTNTDGKFLSFTLTNTSTIKYSIVSNISRSVTIQNQNTLLTIDVDFYGNSYTINGITLTGVKYSGYIGNTAKVIGNSGGTNFPSVSGRFYSLLHYRNGSLIHEYVACQDSSGACGIFDVNTSTFIQNTNPNQTDVTAGPAV